MATTGSGEGVAWWLALVGVRGSLVASTGRGEGVSLVATTGRGEGVA